MTHKNWAGNLTYSTNQLYEPTSIEQIQEIVEQSQKVKVLGSRHSFNTIADSSDVLISLKKMNKVVEHNNARKTVTIEAGMRYGELANYLHQNSYALHNLASLPHISVVGACATATHGSGVKNGNLATAVSRLEFIAGDGEHYRLSRGDHDFDGAVVNLGAIGVITNITLDIEPTYDVQQDVYLNLPFSQLEQHFEAIMSSAYSVSMFTHWQDKKINQVWLKSRVEDNPEFGENFDFYGAEYATQRQHPIDGVPAENATEQLGVAGAWHDRLPHFRMDFTPSKGDELQSEYFIARQDAVEAIQRLFAIGDVLAPVMMVSEIRCIAADTLWLSPCYQQDCVAFHFTWKQDWDALKQVLPKLEKALNPFSPHTHWGKLSTMPVEQIRSNYPKLPDFKNLVKSYDPNGKFRNDFLDQMIFS